MTHRDHMTTERRRAMELLDMVRAGLSVPYRDILRALIVTGDAAGLGHSIAANY